MTQPTSPLRRLVAVGRYKAGTPVYAICDPDLLATGATAAAGKSWTANLRRPAGERP